MTQKRKRSVVLTPAALDLVRAQVEKRWQELGQGKKLTKEVQAELLGVSVATVTRMLAGNGVDRTSVQTAFRNINLEWRRELVMGSDIAPGQLEDELSVNPIESDVPVASKSARYSVRARSVFAYAGVAVLSLGTVLALLGWRARSAPPTLTKQAAIEYERLLGNHAFTLFSASSYDSAITEAGNAVQMARDLGLQVDLAANLRILGDIYEATGRSSDAITAYEEARKIFQSMSEFHRLPPIYEAIGMAQLRSGQYEAASQNLWQAYTGWHTQRDLTGQAMAARDLGTLALELHKTKEAIRWFDEAEAFLPKVGQDDLKMDIRAQRALATAYSGATLPAISQLCICEQYWKVRSHQRWIATTHLQLGLAMLLASRSIEAERFLNLSSEEFALCGDRIGLKKVNNAKKLLHSHGVS